MQVLPGMQSLLILLLASHKSQWTEYPPSSIRKANFIINNASGTAEVTVFPGDVGGTLANINRWSQQTSLARLMNQS